VVELPEEVVPVLAERHTVVVRIGRLDCARRCGCDSEESLVERSLDACREARCGIICPPCQVRRPIDDDIDPTFVLRERNNIRAEGMSIA
jgi:hypothetical protein